MNAKTKTTPRARSRRKPTLRERLRTAASIELRCEPDTIEIEGNASAIDAATDAETTRWIHAQLEAGNEWAWCVVTLIVRVGRLESRSVLGGCSYESEANFRACEYETMLAECIDDLEKQARALAPVICGGLT